MDPIQEAVEIVEDVAAGNLTAAEELLLADIMSGPMTAVGVLIQVKFRAFDKTFGTLPFLNHVFQLPVPGVYAKANPNPVNINSNGIVFKVTLTPDVVAAAAPAASGTGTATGKSAGEPIAAPIAVTPAPAAPAPVAEPIAAPAEPVAPDPNDPSSDVTSGDAENN